MAIYRQIRIDFWEDTKVVDTMTPEDRYFMLYLMTNPHTNQIGCYPITIRQIEFETGYNRDTILKLLDRFDKILNLVKYSDEDKEILILNWHKYNWSNSPKVKACILKEFESIKNKEFRYRINTLFLEYEYSIDTETQEKKEKKEKKEEKKEKRNKDIPTKKEIEDYLKILGKKIDIENFMNYYEASNWCDKAGLPINWKQKAVSWSMHNQKVLTEKEKAQKWYDDFWAEKLAEGNKNE